MRKCRAGYATLSVDIPTSRGCSAPDQPGERCRPGLRVASRSARCPGLCYGAALDYFTGSKAHSIALRTLGVEHGLRVASEYGIFRLPRDAHAAQPDKEGGERIGGAREEDLYRILKLDYVPPELREDRGEIQAAREHKLPQLISLDDIRGDLHLHSKWTDGRNWIERNGARL